MQKELPERVIKLQLPVGFYDSVEYEQAEELKVKLWNIWRLPGTVLRNDECLCVHSSAYVLFNKYAL